MEHETVDDYLNKFQASFISVFHLSFVGIVKLASALTGPAGTYIGLIRLFGLGDGFIIDFNGLGIEMIVSDSARTSLGDDPIHTDTNYAFHYSW